MIKRINCEKCKVELNGLPYILPLNKWFYLDYKNGNEK